MTEGQLSQKLAPLGVIMVMLVLYSGATGGGSVLTTVMLCSVLALAFYIVVNQPSAEPPKREPKRAVSDADKSDKTTNRAKNASSSAQTATRATAPRAS